MVPKKFYCNICRSPRQTNCPSTCTALLLGSSWCLTGDVAEALQVLPQLEAARLRPLAVSMHSVQARPQRNTLHDTLSAGIQKPEFLRSVMPLRYSKKMQGILLPPMHRVRMRSEKRNRNEPGISESIWGPEQFEALPPFLFVGLFACF